MDNTPTPEQQRALDAIESAYTYHPPTPEQQERYTRLRQRAKELATLIIVTTPASREQSLALTNLEQAIYFAQAAIARHS
jgi:hypothetical protein